MKRYLKKLQSTYGKAFIHVSSIVVAVVLLGFSAQAAVNYRATSGGTTVATEFSICKSIVNNSGLDLFIPTNTIGEWSSFYTSPPAGVSVSPCAIPPSIAISPTSYSYGTLNENQVATATFTVTNSGGPGTLSQSLSQPVNTGFFTFVSSTCPFGSTMPAGGSCTVTISFTAGLVCGGPGPFHHLGTYTVVAGASSASTALEGISLWHSLTVQPVYFGCR